MLASHVGILLCSLAGLILMIIEAFLPGFGVAGFTGLAAEIGAIIMAWIFIGPGAAAILFVVLAAITCLLILIAYRSLKKGKLNHFVLKNDESGFQASDDLTKYLDQSGMTVSALRPAGIVEIQGNRISAQSEAEFIPENVQVTVSAVHGNTVVVKRI